MYKKKMMAILVVVLLLLTACTPQQDSGSETTTVPPASSDSTETTAVSSDSAETTVASTESPETTAAQTTATSKADDELYPYANLLENVTDYVADGDISKLEYFNTLQFELVDDYWQSEYTGQLKKFYYTDQIPQGMRIHFPRLVEDSELATMINEDIITRAFETVEPEYLYYFEVDYDAYIYNDILSIKLTQDVVYEGQDGGAKVVLKAYNFDISDGKLKLLSNREMLKKLNVSLETIQDFVYQYLPDYLYAYCTEDEWLNIDDDINQAVESVTYDLEEDELNIYKNDNNDYYGLELGYEFYYEYSGLVPRANFTLADTTFKMALLSKPLNAIGLIYKAIQEEELPEKSITGKPIKLHVLNEPVGTPVYIASFSEFDDTIDISGVQYGEIETADGINLAELITSKGLPIDNDSDFSNVYLYYTMLPETMPFDVVSMRGTTEDMYLVVAEEAIYDDMRFGSRIQYVFGTAIAAPFVKEFEDGSKASITFEVDGTFEATSSNDYWKQAGIPITEGVYTSDLFNYYLSPCQADIQAGADDFYVFSKRDYNEIYLTYGNVVGAIDDGVELLLYE